VAKTNADSVAENMSVGVSYVGGFGLIAYIFVMLAMVKSNVEPQALIIISFFYLAALFGMVFLMIRQSAMFTKKNAVNRTEVNDQPPPTYLRPATTAQLSEPADSGIGSVTEHTTRALDAVPVDRK
jgi:membrane-bound ClpP family serine protease